MFRQQRKTHQEVSPKLGVDDGSASGSRAQLVFWSLWPHNVTTFTFLFCPPTSKKVKATLHNSLSRLTNFKPDSLPMAHLKAFVQNFQKHMWKRS